MSAATIERLRHGLVPAVPVPFDANGMIDQRSQERYAAWMNDQSTAGVAVWAHTGRGLLLTNEQREYILRSWREAMPDRIIVAGAGGSPVSVSDDVYMESARMMAEHAASLGADSLLCYAPVRFRERDSVEQTELILQYHRSLASAGLPLILFYLYEAAGGISYSTDVLSRLLRMPEVIGIKIATLDSIMTFQDVSKLCRTVAPEKLVITGEDRFLGYSLMCGADAALIGMGAAYTRLQAEFLANFFARDHHSFGRLNTHVDRLAQATFTHPMEGYIARMSYILRQQGIFDEGTWRDPWGPAIDANELLEIDRVISALDHGQS